MTTVYWNYFGNDASWFELALIDPTPALAEIIKNRTATDANHFTRCPAFVDYYQNTYVIKSPINIEIKYDKDTAELRIRPQHQNFYEKNIQHRGGIIGAQDDFLLSINLGYLFIADKDCVIELIPAFMHKSEFIDKTRPICGTFNINKWFRPLDLAFELKDSDSTLKIKRGDPLVYVRFIPSQGGKVSLKQKNFPEEALQGVKACLYIKDLQNKMPLSLLYKLSERIRDKFWFNKNKCPFNWRNK